MNGLRKSDSLIVSKMPLNKTRDNKRMAEEAEKSRLAKGNLSSKTGTGHRAGEPCTREFGKIRQAARQPVRHYLRQEPSAVVPHAGICAGGAG